MFVENILSLPLFLVFIPFRSFIFVVVFIFGSLTFIRCTGHRRFSKILVRHLQELHAHNHIHSVWIDVDLANFFVYVWNQFVCKSIMSECNHLSFVLPYQKQNTKPTKTFSLCAYEHWPHLLYIYLLWIANTKTNWSNRHSMWNFEIPAAEWQIEREKKIFEIYFTFCLFISEQMLYHFDIIWMFHSIFINCLRW